MSEWIKCKDELPDESKTVLVFSSSGNIYTCRVSVIISKNSAPEPTNGTRERFTHWQLLPDPPA